MQPDTTTTSRPWTGARIASVVAGTVAAVVAIGFLAAGGVMLWGDAKKDDAGYLTTAREPFATDAYALATDNLDIDLDGAGWVMDRGELGEIRVDVQPRNGKPVFVGIAPTSEVSAYLRGTSHTSVSDVSYSPFRASYRDREGDRAPARPAEERIWAASQHGTGTQSLTWDAEDGDWSVVVMNADGSRDVDVRIGAGAKVPFLATAGWVSLGGGALLLTAAGALLLIGARRPRTSLTASQPPAVPAAA